MSTRFSTPSDVSSSALFVTPQASQSQPPRINTNTPQFGKKGTGQKSKPSARRHRKLLKDHIYGVTKPDIRRLARRGGVRRISAQIYSDVRLVLKARLTEILRMVVSVLECTKRKTITTLDVVFVLQRMGKPIYGFGPSWNEADAASETRREHN